MSPERAPVGPRGPVNFIIDQNVAKLAKYLRTMGYDADVFTGDDDGDMVRRAASEGRVILTRDRQVMLRRIVTSGEARALLLKRDDPEEQIGQVVAELGLDWRFAPFTVCLVDNGRLEPVACEDVRKAVPVFVFRNQERFTRCSRCGRIFWRGTHWRAMEERLSRLEKRLA